MTANARNTFGHVAKSATGIMYCGQHDQIGRHRRRGQPHVPAGRENILIPIIMTTGMGLGDNDRVR